MKKAQLPTKASFLTPKGSWGTETVTGPSSPFLPCLFTSLGGCQLAPIWMKVLCCEHLSTSSWPEPKSISQETPNSCQMVRVWVNTNEHNPPCHGGEGPQFLLCISGCSQPPSSNVLARCPSPDQQLPYFCELGSPHWSKYLARIKPELTCVCLRAND